MRISHGVMGTPVKRYILSSVIDHSFLKFAACVVVLIVLQRQGIVAFQDVSVPSPSRATRCRSSTTRFRA